MAGRCRTATDARQLRAGPAGPAARRPGQADLVAGVDSPAVHPLEPDGCGAHVVAGELEQAGEHVRILVILVRRQRRRGTGQPVDPVGEVRGHVRAGEERGLGQTRQCVEHDLRIADALRRAQRLPAVRPSGRGLALPLVHRRKLAGHRRLEGLVAGGFGQRGRQQAGRCGRVAVEVAHHGQPPAASRQPPAQLGPDRTGRHAVERGGQMGPATVDLTGGDAVVCGGHQPAARIVGTPRRGQPHRGLGQRSGGLRHPCFRPAPRPAPPPRPPPHPVRRRPVPGGGRALRDR